MATSQPSKPVSSIPKYLRYREICERLSITQGGLRGMVAAGNFPQPVQPGPRALGFRESDVLAWLATRPTTDQQAAG